MAFYKVILKPSVEKDLRSLPQWLVARVFGHIEALQDDPLPRGTRKLNAAQGHTQVVILTPADVVGLLENS